MFLNSLLMLLGLGILIGILFIFLKKTPSKPSLYPYTIHSSLLTPSERSFFGVLTQALNTDYIIFAKIRMADILKVDTGIGKSAWQSAFNKINSKHLDFVICHSSDLSLVCAIELDDKSHKQRKARDEFVDNALSAAEIPLFRFPVKPAYELAEIRNELSGAIKFQTPNDALDTKDTDSDPNRLPEKTCPKCGSIMVLKTAKKGQHAGKEFWACSAFPNCKTALPLGNLLT